MVDEHSTNRPSGSPTTGGGGGSFEYEGSRQSRQEQFGGAIRSARERMGEKGQEAGAWAKSAGSALVHGQLDRAAHDVDGFAEASRAAAEKLREAGDQHLAEWMDAVSENMRSAGQYLRDRTPRDIYDDIEGFGRRRPELVVGGLFVAGLALARFLRASRERTRAQEEEQFARATPSSAYTPPSGYGTPGYSPAYAGEGS